jgi:pimeloyl-ACP methyl ester carboxylesterase
MEFYMQIILKLFVLIMTVVLSGGCSTNAPLNTLYYQMDATSTQKEMLIFLRGRGEQQEYFASAGYVADIKRRQLPFDMAVPNAHFGYYLGETLVPRLKADIIDPARAKGYERFWLVGVSMGGLGALMYTREHPDDIAGVCLISPFLGYAKIIKEITAAGGVANWQPGEYDPKSDWQRMLWHWLKQQAQDADQPLSKIYLGYGDEDSYTQAHGLLKQLLPVDHVFITSGGHDQETMKRVWDIYLENDVLKK